MKDCDSNLAASQRSADDWPVPHSTYHAIDSCFRGPVGSDHLRVLVRVDGQPDRHDATRLPSRRRAGVQAAQSRRSEAVSYALLRGGRWITAPKGDGEPIPPVLAIEDDSANAWRAPNIDIAIERQQLLRLCWGWATEIRAIRP